MYLYVNYFVIFYSQAVKVDKTMYISGQLGLDAKTMEFAGDDVKTQANMVDIKFALFIVYLTFMKILNYIASST